VADRVCGCADAPACPHTSVPEQRLAEAIWPAGQPDALVADTDEQTVWCKADRSPFGGYMLTIEFDADNVLALNRDSLFAYVAAMADALVRAQYTEGVRRQLVAVLGGRGTRKGKGMSEREAGMLAIAQVQELRDDWPDLPTFPPYSIKPVVSFEGRCSVQVWRGEQVIVQFAPRNVNEHIVHALRVYAAADLDESYRRMLIGVIGLDAARATACVADLANYHREE
jgi:hypothetical protein